MECSGNLAKLIAISIFLNSLECFAGPPKIGAIDRDNWKLLPTNCGRTRYSKRIIGGRESLPGQFPWIARLAIRKRRSVMFLCAGSLISEYFVVTAAHCLDKDKLENLKFVRLGETISAGVKCGDECPPGIQDIPIDKVIMHSEFDEKTIKNDIALIKLARKAEFNDYVQPVCLPQGKLLRKLYKLTGKIVQIAGWGQTNMTNSLYPDHLRYIFLPVVKIKKCVEIYGDLLDIESNSQYCAGQGDGTDTCEGDSGGPMVRAVTLRNFPRRFYLFGVVSYGFQMCGDEAAVYTRIPYYVKWILNNMN